MAFTLGWCAIAAVGALLARVVIRAVQEGLSASWRADVVDAMLTAASLGLASIFSAALEGISQPLASALGISDRELAGILQSKDISAWEKLILRLLAAHGDLAETGAQALEAIGC